MWKRFTEAKILKQQWFFELKIIYQWFKQKTNENQILKQANYNKLKTKQKAKVDLISNWN